MHITLDRRTFGRLSWSAALAPSLGLTSGGCGPTLPAVRKDDGENRWARATSENFVLEGTTSAERLESLSQEFEILRAAFLSVPFLGKTPPKDQTTVVVFSDVRQYRYFFPERSGGWVGDGPIGHMVCIPAYAGAFGDDSVKNGLALSLLRHFLPPGPTWLHHGLAQLMETAALFSDGKLVRFGNFSDRLLWRAHQGVRKVSAPEFMNPWPSTHLTGYYGKSWLLVHYLVDNHQQSFVKFLVRVSRGEKWTLAWEQEIPLEQPDVDGVLGRYLTRAKFGLWKVSAQSKDVRPAVVSRPPVADTLALRAALYALNARSSVDPAERGAGMSADLEAVRRMDPDNARLRRVEDWLQAPPGVEREQ